MQSITLYSSSLHKEFNTEDGIPTCLSFGVALSSLWRFSSSITPLALINLMARLTLSGKITTKLSSVAKSKALLIASVLHPKLFHAGNLDLLL